MSILIGNFYVRWCFMYKPVTGIYPKKRIASLGGSHPSSNEIVLPKANITWSLATARNWTLVGSIRITSSIIRPRTQKGVYTFYTILEVEISIGEGMGFLVKNFPSSLSILYKNCARKCEKPIYVQGRKHVLWSIRQVALLSSFAWHNTWNSWLFLVDELSTNIYCEWKRAVGKSKNIKDKVYRKYHKIGVWNAGTVGKKLKWIYFVFFYCYIFI